MGGVGVNIYSRGKFEIPREIQPEKAAAHNGYNQAEGDDRKQEEKEQKKMKARKFLLDDHLITFSVTGPPEVFKLDRITPRVEAQRIKRIIQQGLWYFPVITSCSTLFHLVLRLLHHLTNQGYSIQNRTRSFPGRIFQLVSLYTIYTTIFVYFKCIMQEGTLIYSKLSAWVPTASQIYLFLIKHKESFQSSLT